MHMQTETEREEKRSAIERQQKLRQCVKFVWCASERASETGSDRERARTCQSAAVRDRSLCRSAVKRALPDHRSSTARNGKTPKGK